MSLLRRWRTTVVLLEEGTKRCSLSRVVRSRYVSCRPSPRFVPQLSITRSGGAASHLAIPGTAKMEYLTDNVGRAWADAGRRGAPTNARCEHRPMTNGPVIDRAKPAPLIGAVVILISLGAALVSSRANEPNESDDKQSSGAAAARALLQSLPEAKRTKAKLSFDSPERTNW